MSNYSLTEVCDKRTEKEFLKVADIIYKDDPNWVHPLDNDILNVFNPKKNERFNGGEAIRWVLKDGNQYIGRIAAFYNNEDAAREPQPTGACGFFECINSQEAANYLFDTAREWLKSKGMEAMDGSVNFGDRMTWWGVLKEGFTKPCYGMNYNKPYYADLFENYGFQCWFNQITYLRELKEEVVMPQALHEKANRLFENPEYHFSTFKKKQPEKMARDIMSVYNSGWADFEGVKLLDFDHAMAMVNSMGALVDEDVLYMAYHNDKPIGFFVMVPDLNQMIYDFKGKFGLLQKLKILYRLKTKKVNNLEGLIFGVASEYQGRGVEAAMIRQFEIYTQKQRAEGKEQYKTLQMCWIGDFNPVMMRMCESYVVSVKYKRHITYRFLFDREKEFTRCPNIRRKKRKEQQQ